MFNLDKVFPFVVLVVLVWFISSCSSNDKGELADHGREALERRKLLYKFARSMIGQNEYHLIQRKLADSIEFYKKNRLKSFYYDDQNYSTTTDSLLCINTANNKFITSRYIRYSNNSKMDAIEYFYGVKIKEQWYFFSGPTVYIPRDPENLKTPTSFTKLHEIAIDNIFKGYLKKNKESGEWEINEGFFADLTGNAGCADCETQVQWDSVYLATVRENWKNRDTTNYKPLQ